MITPYHETEHGILYCGDCLDILPTLADKSVDLVLTDPPYGTTACKWDSIIPFAPLWEEIDRITDINTAVVLFGSQPFTSTLINSNINMFKYEWIWEKTQATGFLDSRIKPLKAHENILVFYHKQPTYNYIKTTGHERKVSSAIHKRNTKTNQAEIYHKSDNFTDYDSTERYPRSVLRFKSDKQKEALHPTQKPVELIKYMAETYSNATQTVLDFAAGSGTTAIACIRLNRKYILIEKEEKYCEIVKERIETELDQLQIEL